MPSISTKWNDSDLITAVAQADCFVDVLQTLNLAPIGGNYRTIYRNVLRLGLSTKHFTQKRRREALQQVQNNKETPRELVLCVGSLKKSGQISKYLRKYNLIPYVCLFCGNPGLHRGLRLTLQVDHINGVPNDNRLENLRFLCPNCHTQTDTFAGRACRKTHAPRYCPCGQPVKGRQTYCSPSCATKSHSKPKVAYTLLQARYRELQSYRAVAKEFGVSDTTVKNAVLQVSLIS